MRRKKKGNTFLDISSRRSSIQTYQTPWGFFIAFSLNWGDLEV